MQIERQHARRIRLLITADDFGRDEVCTRAIADALARGQVTAASIMANGACFEEACGLVRTRDLHGRIGVHLSLDEGPPLAPEMRRFADPKAGLCVRRSLVPFGRDLARAVEAELAAQIERVIAAGIHPTHVDSHRHIHTAFPIGRLVVRVARRYGIPYVRPARNLVRAGSRGARAYKWMFNRYLRTRVRTADYFGDVVDFFAGGYAVPATSLIECMIHLDNSPRGLEGQQVLRNEGFLRFLQDYELVGHANASR